MLLWPRKTIQPVGSEHRRSSHVSRLGFISVSTISFASFIDSRCLSQCRLRLIKPHLLNDEFTFDNN